ncbi:MAG TPA: precorrin-6A synthase (deacetylating) [Devosia sp.]|jgi:precorrin-6A synthase|uniref:precorrin-6A synthase (deacetylating) n=1 Tax=Devosia sp. TaxID=1871048 RepID=UPI002DDD1062|nr:precorrin-6A synthase (deacetylating) [Devosia sp.]HEV2518518.1 precorrin-6A synthase (deacetylating) [Devosia sp.]
MRTILVIGIGAGNPDYLTLQAVKAMNRAQVFFMPDKGEEKAGLNAIRLAMLEQFVTGPRYRLVEFAIPSRRKAETPDYRDSVKEWRDKLEVAYRRMFAELSEDGVGAFLVWGDPALYDGTLRILKDMQAAGWEIAIEVIPGISAPQALAAQHQVTLNRVGEAVTITTGRRVGEGEADGLSSAVVMLDNHQVFRRFAADQTEIFWGAYLGTADEILVAGQVSEVMDEIDVKRREAQARNGWIMDTYMIRKPE